MATVKEITGGTGDVNPQTLTESLTQSAADTNTTLEIPVPIARFQLRKGKSIIMEILQVKWILDDLVTPGGAVNVSGFLSTRSGTPNLTTSTVFSQVRVDGIFATAVGISYVPLIYNDVLHDGAGHGFLVATDNIYLTVRSTNTSAANLVTAKIFYRFKEVSLEEYLGIVASQS